MKPLFFLIFAISTGLAEDGKKTRSEMVQEDRSDFGESEIWVYNDLEKGFARARVTGKPLLVVHRCVP